MGLRIFQPSRWPVVGIALLATVLFTQADTPASPPLQSANHTATGKPSIIGYELLQQKPHNTDWFTQGLLIDGEWIYEATGRYHHSKIIQYHQDTNDIKTTYQLDPKVFGEGLALLNGTLYWLSWKKGTLYLFDDQLTPAGTLHYDGEGWGLTTDGNQLIMSNGSSQLLFRNPQTFAIERTITAHHTLQKPKGFKTVEWENLNELEYVDGIIWANQWQEAHILAIDAETGQVLAILPLPDLTQANNDGPLDNVLNGIAYVPGEHAFWVTGKNWHSRYLIRPQPWPTASSITLH